MPVQWYLLLPNAAWMRFFLFMSVFTFLYSTVMSIIKTIRLTERMQIDWNATEAILCGCVSMLYFIANGLATGSIAMGQRANIKTYKGKLNFAQLQAAVVFGFFTAFLVLAQSIIDGHRFYQDRKFRKQYSESPQEDPDD
ncbi:uncharacterized protein TRIADDRAFT_55656 [Trichoplax adhaerens]|uniref:MARVEL domain-containing protein n=1 Tax=Trichoplax adhaerens TaxID=10228 RepID=B3RVH6_TRIAD|nr:predicted protein [Trichoplax adhaerens]EDV25996.1 predicted protein [Trichoplax adhaerens]|eukprot:XP_002112029.1 predicted protein [Trichoplax adhaerens]